PRTSDDAPERSQDDEHDDGRQVEARHGRQHPTDRPEYRLRERGGDAHQGVIRIQLEPGQDDGDEQHERIGVDEEVKEGAHGGSWRVSEFEAWYKSRERGVCPRSFPWFRSVRSSF